MNEVPNDASPALAARGGPSRRSLVKKGLVGGAILLVGGSVPILFRSGSPPRPPQVALRVLDPREYETFAAAAGRLCAPGPGAGTWPSAEAVACAEKVDALLARLHPKVAAEFRQLLRVFENAMTGLLSVGSPTAFTRSAPALQDRRLEAWRHSRVELFRSGYQAMKRLAHATYYSSPETYARVGYSGPPVVPPVPA
ncbi:MAG: hypothetical protein ABUS79_02445 [Pseudomonadota bacterium]